MKDKYQQLADTMIKLLLTFDPEDRANFIGYIRFNDIFCPYCGEGSVEKPNPNCQCENDE